MVRAGLVATLVFALFGCATYRDDFVRARGHYDANEYDKALLLLEVLERDIDSLSAAERAQYAYVRGMSHFRLEQKRDARHWLGNAAAREFSAQGSLSTDAKARVDELLKKLNGPYFGESNSGDTSTGECRTDLDCEKKGQFCDAGACATAGAEETRPSESNSREQGDAASSNPAARGHKSLKKKKKSDVDSE